MLPPGHIAGGYLVAFAFLKIVNPGFDQSQINQFLLWGMFFGFVPDLDMFVTFGASKSFTITSKYNHRKFFTHVPVVWLIAGLLVYILSTNPFQRSIGLLIWLASWSHFLFDSLQYGIRWLYPFSKKLYSVRDTGVEMDIQEKEFFVYWIVFLKKYAQRFKLTCYSELGVIALALIIFFTK